MTKEEFLRKMSLLNLEIDRVKRHIKTLKQDYANSNAIYKKDDLVSIRGRFFPGRVFSVSSLADATIRYLVKDEYGFEGYCLEADLKLREE